MNYTVYSNECQEQKQKKVPLEIIEERKNEQMKHVSALISALRAQNFYTEDKEKRIKECADYVEVSETGRIIRANFCKNKFCPICNWRRSRKTFAEMNRLQEELDSTTDNEYIFLTLTLKNTKSLAEGTNTIIRAFYNLIHNRTWKKAVKGYARTVEITYNEKTDEWHPHIHTIIAVDDTYWKNNYLSHADFTDLWKKAAKIKYTPIVDVRKVTDDTGGAIAEISKYAVKPLSLRQSEKKTLESLYTELLEALHNRRLRTFGGIIKETARRLNIEPETENFDDNEVTAETRYFYKRVDGKYKEMMRIENGVSYVYSNI